GVWSVVHFETGMLLMMGAVALASILRLRVRGPECGRRVAMRHSGFGSLRHCRACGADLSSTA
ncbi:MAG TPA: hypothetical protein VIL35_12325, partial [Vicinamibacterales bacterium]